MPLALSSHFTLEELTASAHRGFDNTPDAEVIANLKMLATETLEDVRFFLGAMHITSGYRCPELNAAVGGQPTSQHMSGLAADFVPTRYSLQESARRILAQQVEFDQFIYEFGRWLHISHAPCGKPSRREALMVGAWTGGKYLPLDLAKVPR